MSERYTKLFSLPENLYEKDCPVMICAGALSKDNQTDKVFVQLRFQNIDSRYRAIVAIKVAIQAFGIANNTLGNAIEHQYLDIKAERSAEAGGKQPIYLDDNTTRSFSVSVLEVVFEEGNIWTGNSQNWCSLQQMKLSDKFSAELTAQYQRDTFAEAKYEPFAKDGIWMCACGTLNTVEDSKCCRCHNSKSELFKALDHTTLSENLKAYTDIKNNENHHKQKKKKIIIMVCSALCAIVLVLGMFLSSINKKGQMVDALEGYVKYNANDTVWVFSSDGTYLTKFFFDGECINEWTGVWETVSVSGNTMRITVDTWGIFEVEYKKNNGQYFVDSIEKAS